MKSTRCKYILGPWRTSDSNEIPRNLFTSFTDSYKSIFHRKNIFNSKKNLSDWPNFIIRLNSGWSHKKRIGEKETITAIRQQQSSYKQDDRHKKLRIVTLKKHSSQTTSFAISFSLQRATGRQADIQDGSFHALHSILILSVSPPDCLPVYHIASVVCRILGSLCVCIGADE